MDCSRNDGVRLVKTGQGADRARPATRTCDNGGGGAGRIRTSNQAVMSEAPTRADPEHADLGARLPRHHPNRFVSLRGALRRASDIAAGRLYPRIVGEYCDGPLSDIAHQPDLAHVAPICERLGRGHDVHTGTSNNGRF